MDIVGSMGATMSDAKIRMAPDTKQIGACDWPGQVESLGLAVWILRPDETSDIIKGMAQVQGPPSPFLKELLDPQSDRS